MKITLAENIRTLRKARSMTQERLAEAMGVSVGAVHKWETGSSMPEIRLLMELADLFGVSVDALLGYEITGSSVDDIIERINSCLHTKDFDSALTEADKAMLRYPNNFRIVSCCADAYERKGIETGDKTSLMRAIELWERSVPLLSQNSDPEISEMTIRSDIATCYIMLGQTDKGLEILKRYNYGGINNALLGLIHSQDECFSAPDAEKYLVRGLGGIVIDAIRCMSGYVRYYVHKGNIPAALEASQWLTGFLQSLREDTDELCYFDRVIATFHAVSASMLRLLGSEEQSDRLLGQAYKMAVAFDARPVFDARAVKFVIGEVGNATASDDMGESVMAAIEKILRSDERIRPTLERWEQLKKTCPTENTEG